MPRQSLDNAPDRDEAPQRQGIFRARRGLARQQQPGVRRLPRRAVLFAALYRRPWRLAGHHGCRRGFQRPASASLFDLSGAGAGRKAGGALRTDHADQLRSADWQLSEMDWSDGELRIRTAMPLEQGNFTDMQLEHIFYGNLALANRYLAGVCGSAFGNVTPEVALELAQVPCKESLQ